uniref:Uncharacterized protein n=1 Tax=Pseudictyota dubia TaxID=2749911 RepID=A0A7R9YVW0_9STRA|mmetsp:Transcript_10019/g.19107  ORF Transcript_10019/g.19107 Transcript_10019/m.19107 type:complete len:211 (+) Transcript_10019:246-878(+)
MRFDIAALLAFGMMGSVIGTDTTGPRRLGRPGDDIKDLNDDSGTARHLFCDSYCIDMRVTIWATSSESVWEGTNGEIKIDLWENGSILKQGTIDGVSSGGSKTKEWEMPDEDVSCSFDANYRVKLIAKSDDAVLLSKVRLEKGKKECGFWNPKEWITHREWDLSDGGPFCLCTDTSKSFSGVGVFGGSCHEAINFFSGNLGYRGVEVGQV